jgi:hypothetical protein
LRAESSVTDVGTVEFSVLDQNGNPAEGVQVFLVNRETKQSLVETTAAGRAVFEGVAPGTWEVSVSEDWARFAGLIKITGSAGAGANYGQAAAIGLLGLGAAGGTVAIVDSSGDSKPLSPAS